MSKYVTKTDVQRNPSDCLEDELAHQYGHNNVSNNLDGSVTVYHDDGKEYAVFDVGSGRLDSSKTSFVFDGKRTDEDVDDDENPTTLSASISLTPEEMVESLERMDEEEQAEANEEGDLDDLTPMSYNDDEEEWQ